MAKRKIYWIIIVRKYRRIGETTFSVVKGKPKKRARENAHIVVVVIHPNVVARLENTKCFYAEKNS